eukprot:scaffold2006_cov141-Isochrysis_galbana.AAC.12
MAIASPPASALERYQSAAPAKEQCGQVRNQTTHDQRSPVGTETACQRSLACSTASPCDRGRSSRELRLEMSRPPVPRWKRGAPSVCAHGPCRVREFTAEHAAVGMHALGRRAPVRMLGSAAHARASLSAVTAVMAAWPSMCSGCESRPPGP